uniref:Uncharacterized protein n=1 Tax=Scophthalmus maximus TaxID=52904 RepID=A0A8D2ZSN3_SCOMX
MWPGTRIADGTRFVKVQFNDTVQSLPYSVKFITVTDPNGRIIVVDPKKNDKTYRIINVYAPNQDKERKLSLKIYRQILLNIMKEKNLVDSWRVMEPNKKEFSRNKIVEGI